MEGCLFREFQYGASIGFADTAVLYVLCGDFADMFKRVLVGIKCFLSIVLAEC